MHNNEQILETVWKSWAEQYTERSHEWLYRFQPRNKRFEDWLLDNGAMVVQKNTHRLLRVNSDKQKTWFLIKYG